MAGIPLDQLLSSLYGVKSSHKINPVVSAVGVTAIKLVKLNPNRLSLTIVNLSGNGIYISPDPDVSATKGLYIASNGGFLTLQWDRDFQLVAQEFWAIAGGAGSNVFILENVSIS